MKLSRCIGVLAVTWGAWFGFSAMAQDNDYIIPYSVEMPKRWTDDLIIGFTGKPFMVINGISDESGKMVRPSTPAQVEILLTTPDGKQWRAKWEEETRRAPDGVNWITDYGDGTSSITAVKVIPTKPLTDYERGFNAALEYISLLNLELRLNGEQKTFGEMAAILRKRHKVRAKADE